MMYPCLLQRERGTSRTRKLFFDAGAQRSALIYAIGERLSASIN